MRGNTAEAAAQLGASDRPASRVGRRLLDARCLLFPNRKDREGPRSAQSLQGKQRERKSRYRPHRAGARSRPSAPSPESADYDRGQQGAASAIGAVPGRSERYDACESLLAASSAVVGCAAVACQSRWALAASKRAKPTSPAPPVSGHFTDIRKSAGITFVQDSTQTDEKYYLETMGTGVAGSTTTRTD